MNSNSDFPAAILTRRRAVTAIAATLAAGSLIRARAQQPTMQEQASTPANQDRTSIHYEIDFKADPQHLYDIILDPKQFAAFTGMQATIDATPGGAFSQFGGLIVGRNVELVSNQRIVQAWRPTHWAPGIYSIAHFEFKPRGAETTLFFDHTGFPASEYDSLDRGWHNHYWEPLKKFLV
jgi:activator of HSP90 ATPase